MVGRVASGGGTSNEERVMLKAIAPAPFTYLLVTRYGIVQRRLALPLPLLQRVPRIDAIIPLDLDPQRVPSQLFRDHVRRPAAGERVEDPVVLVGKKLDEPSRQRAGEGGAVVLVA